jgi:PAS domain S-box-containing protein
MANETANRASESLLPASLLDTATREAILSASTPSLLINRRDGRVLWSSHVAARRLGTESAADLVRLGLPALSPGTQRLVSLVQGIAAEAPRRLERLRFNTGFRSQIVTAMCEPIALASGDLALLVSLVDAAPSRNDAYLAPEVSEVDAPVEDGLSAPLPMPLSMPLSMPPSLPTPPLARRHDDPREAGAETLSAEEAPAVAVQTQSHPDKTAIPTAPAWTTRPNAERKPVRFVFGLDANGVVSTVTPPLAETVGEENAGILGRPLAAIVQDFDPSAAEAIRSAILGGETWSGIQVQWPVARTDLAVPIDLSALPLMDAERGLTGFSGFGRCHLDQAESVASPVLAIADDAPPDLIVEPEALEAAEQLAPEAEPETGSDADMGDLLSALEVFGEPVPEDGPSQAVAGETASGDLPDASGENKTAPLVPSAQPDTTPSPASANVVSLRTGQPEFVPQNGGRNGLSMAERNAFREIARALGAKFDEDNAGDAGPTAYPMAAMGQPSDFLPPQLPSPPAADNTPPVAMPPAEPVTGALPPVEVEKRAEEPAPRRLASPPADLLNQLPIGVLVLRGDEPLFANRTLLDLTDYPDFQTFLSEDGARAIFRKSTMPRDRETGFDTIVLTTRDAELIPVDAHLQLTDWEGGKATLISLRRAVELEQGKVLRSVALDLKRIRAEAHELRAVLDTATDGVITLDEKGKILSINGAAEALFGLNQNEVVGDSFTTLLHNESHADALDYFEGLRANGVRSVLNDGRDVFGREKKGGRIPLFMTLGRISDDEPRRYCAVLRDLTSWKRAESELTEARRSAELASAKKSDFLTKISHEIRTPMNAIIGFAEVMMEERLGPVGNPKYKEYLGDIRTSGKHVVSLVNDLLDLAKIEAGRMEMSFASTDLNAIVASSVGLIQPQANQNRVLVRSQLAQKLPPVVADERSIRQIILNMLSNATRFTESGGQVIIATGLLETGEAVIRIRDTGVGMTAVEIEQALEPFRQVGTRRDHGGTGLGLPLTKALVEANRANFSIRSTPGEGTMVEITFPSTRVLAE